MPPPLLVGDEVDEAGGAAAGVGSGEPADRAVAAALAAFCSWTSFSVFVMVKSESKTNYSRDYDANGDALVNAGNVSSCASQVCTLDD